VKPRRETAGGGASARDAELWRWERVGLAATLVILVTVPLALLKFQRREPPPATPRVATYIGRQSCRECHRDAYDRWTGSDHDLAMQVASDSTVLGDFSDATFDHFGVASRFYRRDGKFWVRTQGPQGTLEDYEIAYAFGFRPLQQYLVRFPGGRLQCLSIAWDVDKQRWYHLYPDTDIPPADWLHWTRPAQNWNGMCADCHSTNLRKGYDPQSDAYNTTWSEIDVSCEACHGPASLHLEWARLPAMARPASEDYGLVISTRGMSSREQVELCARCHSRRFTLHDYRHEPGTDLLDHLVPTALDEGLYFPDGQIQDEVYEYGSFVQSKMYRHGVRCTDCHDPHSNKRHAEDNTLCLRCHQRDLYDTRDHHFHQEIHAGKPSAGWLCKNCHMPQRAYMGIDFRADHSMRIPRPDLSLELGTPSACSQAGCHADKSPEWAADAFTKWYGQARRAHYGRIFAAARAGQPEASDDLIRLTQDRSYAAIVRATAVSLLDRYPGPAAQRAVARGLEDEESSVRRAALDQAQLLPPAERLPRLVGVLRDPVEGVRIQAARVLAEMPDRSLAPAAASAFAAALAEYEASMRYQLDFASSGYNLGNLYAALGQPAEAERNYRVSLRIDPLFVRTRVNYALLLSSLGRNPEAETQLRAALEAEPDLAEAQYDLGLLLVETRRLPEGVALLERAVAQRPRFARGFYNLGLAYRELGQMSAANRALRRALDLEPANADHLFALADLELRQGRADEARRITDQWLVQHPTDPRAQQLRAILDRAGSRSAP
jgi:tetratricopeptide (TPR) repeat protein